MVKTYDERCFDLAGVFLGDEPDAASMPPEMFKKLKHELACTIQESIEDWLASRQRRRETAQLNGNPLFQPGSCAHCGKFHSHVCDEMRRALETSD